MSDSPKRREPSFPKVSEIPPLRYWVVLMAVMIMSSTIAGVIGREIGRGNAPQVAHFSIECVVPSEHATAVPDHSAQ